MSVNSAISACAQSGSLTIVAPRLGFHWVVFLYWWFGGGSLVMLMKIGDACGLVVIGIGGLVGPNGGENSSMFEISS